MFIELNRILNSQMYKVIFVVKNNSVMRRAVISRDNR